MNSQLTAGNTIQSIVSKELRSHREDRGRFASAMIHAAVCQAVLDGRPEYLQEFATPNPPVLA